MISGLWALGGDRRIPRAGWQVSLAEIVSLSLIKTHKYSGEEEKKTSDFNRWLLHVCIHACALYTHRQEHHMNTNVYTHIPKEWGKKEYLEFEQPYCVIVQRKAHRL